MTKIVYTFIHGPLEHGIDRVLRLVAAVAAPHVVVDAHCPRVGLDPAEERRGSAAAVRDLVVGVISLQNIEQHSMTETHGSIGG